MNTVPYPWEVDDFLTFLAEMLQDTALPMIAWGVVFAGIVFLAMVLGSAIWLGSKSMIRRWRS